MMLTCPGCQERLFEYVYDLLDDDSSAVRAHLESCASCQAAYQKVLNQQKLLGEASKVPNTLSFSTPKVDPSQTHKFSKKSKIKVTAWYVTVACVLLVLVVGHAGIYWWGRETLWRPVVVAQNKLASLETGRRHADASRERLTLVPAQLREYESTLATLQKEQTERLAEALAAAKSQAVYFQIVAPSSVEAGRPVNYLVINKTLDEKPAPLNNYRIDVLEQRSNRHVAQLLSNNSVATNKLNPNTAQFAGVEANRTYTNVYTPDTPSQTGGQIAHTIQVLDNEYTAHVAMDKPMYQPGEELHFRGLALDKATLQQPKEELAFEFALLDPQQTLLHRWDGKSFLVDEATKQPLRDQQGKPILGVGAGSFTLPEKSPAGEYTLRMAEKTNRFQTQELKFLVNSGAVPKLDKQLRFTRISYAPGDEVRLEGLVKQGNQPWTGAVDAQVLIDGKQYDDQGQVTAKAFTVKSDTAGKMTVHFKLPQQVAEGDATVALKFRLTTGDVETWTQPLRIQTSQVVADCYPEGGDLIANVPNRVYFQLRNTRGEPVDGAAEIIDASRNVIQRLECFHDDSEAKASKGMGIFSITPRVGEAYQVRMTRPGPGQIAATLPPAQPEGVVLQVDEPIITERSPLRLQLTSVGRDRLLYVLVYCRGQLIAVDQCDAKQGKPEPVSISIPYPLGGVYRVTVCELVQPVSSGRMRPVAERLVFGEPGQKLNLQLSASRLGERQLDLKIKANDERNLPTWAYLTVVGVHRSVLELAADATLRRLPAHFLLANEVRSPADLEHADFYLTAHPSARQALDLLLGVQGWRRFKETNLPQVFEKNIDVFADVTYYDNRRDVEKAVEAKVREQVNRETAALAVRIKETEDALTRDRTLLRLEQGRLLATDVQRHDEHDRTQTLLAKSREDWHSFQRMFSLSSAGILAALSLIGALVLVINRQDVPGHLLVTLSLLSTLALVGAGYLGLRTDDHQERPRVLEKRDDKPGAAASTSAVASPEKEAVRGAFGGQAPATGAPMPPMAAPRQEVVQAMPPATVGNPQDADNKKQWAGKGGLQPDLVRSTEKRDAAPPGMPAKPSLDKGIGDSARKAESQAEPMAPAPVPAPPAPQVGNQQVNPPRRGGMGNVDALRTQKAPGGYRQNEETTRQSQVQMKSIRPNVVQERIAEERRTEKAMPPAETRPGDAMKTAPSFGAAAGPERLAAGGAKDGDKERSRPTARGGFAPPAHVYVAREYSWRADRQPAGLRNSAWGQTVYWHPLRVVPHGEISIPLELPPGEATYHFEVYGHDGRGRLGAAALDVKTPLPKPRPLSLRTKLLTEQARLGDVVRLEIEVQNQTAGRQPAIQATVPLPVGLSLPPNLKRLRSSMTGAAYDTPFEPTRWAVSDNELSLAWNELAAGQSVRVTVDLICDKPGHHTAARPAKAYLVNQENDATTTEALRIEIVP